MTTATSGTGELREGRRQLPAEAVRRVMVLDVGATAGTLLGQALVLPECVGDRVGESPGRKVRQHRPASGGDDEILGATARCHHDGDARSERLRNDDSEALLKRWKHEQRRLAQLVRDG